MWPKSDHENFEKRPEIRKEATKSKKHGTFGVSREFLEKQIKRFGEHLF